jgi:hypothetical protein
VIARLLWQMPIVALLVVLVVAFDGWTMFWLTTAVAFANVIGFAEGRWRR